jgi:signal transduction histidine kinase
MLKTLNVINKHALEKSTPISLRDFYRGGKQVTNYIVLRQAQFLEHELPIRLSKRISDLHNFPSSLANIHNLQSVHETYLDSLEILVNYPEIKTLEDALEYKDKLQQLLTKHGDVEMNVAKALQFYKKNYIADYKSNRGMINDKLNLFYSSRVGIRLLVNNFISNCENGTGILREFDPATICHNAISELKNMFTLNSMGLYIPEINITHKNGGNITYLPSHLHYIYFEVIKNAIIAYNRNLIYDGKIDIVICNTGDYLCVKISDNAGGIPYNDLYKLFSYFYTKNEFRDDKNTEKRKRFEGLGLMMDTEGMIDGFNPYYGQGHGLGLSRLYAKYFGGDLNVNSIYGIGTDVHIYISKLESSSENVCDVKT